MIFHEWFYLMRFFARDLSREEQTANNELCDEFRYVSASLFLLTCFLFTKNMSKAHPEQLTPSRCKYFNYFYFHDIFEINLLRVKAQNK